VHPDVLGEARLPDAIDERRAILRTRAVVHLEIGLALRETLGHAQDRRDADTAGKQQRALGVDERKVVARRADRDHLTFGEFVMQRDRAASGRGVAQHADLVAVRLGGVVAQRILADETRRSHSI